MARKGKGQRGFIVTLDKKPSVKPEATVSVKDFAHLNALPLERTGKVIVYDWTGGVTRYN